MAVYKLYATNTISTVTTVEAETLNDAIDEAYKEGWHQVMFLNHTYPDMGEWEIDLEVAHEDYPDE